MKTFRDLKVWGKSHYLVLEIYKVTKKFPSEEKFGLVSQIRRAVTKGSIKYFTSVKYFVCHPELVSGSIDAESSSA